MNPLTDINIRVSLHQSKGYAIFLSMLPIVMMYKTPGTGMGLATTMVALGMVYAGCAIYVHWQKIDLTRLFFFIPYLCYAWFASNGMYRLLTTAIFIHLLAISSGAVHWGRLKKMLIGVACVASCCVLLQQLLHLALGLDLQFLYSFLMIDSLQHEGYSSLFEPYHGKNMYRPSAFFIEPSHFGQYAFLGLSACLFSTEKVRYKEAILISVGMFATTSGMGFVMTGAIWLWWGLSKMEKFPVIYKICLFVGVCIIAALLFLILYQIPYFQSILSRFIDTPEGEYNAIEGRTFGWAYFENKDFWDLFWGFGTDSLPDVYFTGFMEQLYMYGWLGVGLLFMYLVWLCLSSRGFARIVMILYPSLYFIAGVSGFIPVIFYIGTVLTFVRSQDEE